MAEGHRRIATKISYGNILGEILVGENQEEYYRFIGIPYARITLPLQKSEKMKDWNRHQEGDWDQILPCGADCIIEGDHSPFRIITQNDLPNEPQVYGRYLFLNVYTPFLPLAKRGPKMAPIMVFIPGEHYFNEFNKTQFYDPRYLVAEGVVVVIVHYRTGVLGFLKYGNVEGNNGLLDILWALKWVQKNCNAFMGDTSNVTVWGQGFGAAHLSHLLSSKWTLLWLPEGALHHTSCKYWYFNRVILQSGSFENRWSWGENDIYKYCRTYNIVPTEGQDYYQALYQTNIQELAQPHRNYFREFHSSARPLYGPEITLGKTMVAQNPEEAISTNCLSEGISIIIGFNSSEGFIANFLNNETERNIETYRPYIEGAPHLNTQTCQNYYGGNVPNLEGFYRMITDICFVRGTLQMLKLLKNPNNMGPDTKIYLYRFSGDDQQLNIMKTNLFPQNPTFHYPGACHGDELGYLFKTPVSPNVLADQQKGAIKKIVTRWANFAKTGVPDAEGQVHWEPVPRQVEGRVPYLNIAQNDQMLEFENTLFLDSLTARIPH